jgi:CRP-like cAMP-binding protein
MRIVFMEILEVSKGNILFNEGDKVNNIFYILEGEFETYKLMAKYSGNKGTSVEYMPLNPSEEIRQEQEDFF